MRLKHTVLHGFYTMISTHAPLARCDKEDFLMVFRPPLISTHAPLARCDHILFAPSISNSYFYSRTSCEVRPILNCVTSGTDNFYSRTSCEVPQMQTELEISTHAPLARCDISSYTRTDTTFIFLLTHLLRGATWLS